MYPLLSGVVPPVATPCTPDLGIDTQSLGRLVDHLLEGGVHGLFALGSTSEVAFLTDPQRDTVLQTVVERVAGRVPVVAGAIDMTTNRVAEHIRRARDRGVQGIVATAPFYTRTHPAEIRRHFQLLKEVAGELPLYAYDLPVSVGVKLDPGSILPLFEEGILAGVKDSSGSDAGLRALILGIHDRGIDNISVLTGSELTVDGALMYGATGVVPGLGNVDPGGYVRLWEAARAGDLTRARAEQERLFRLFGLVEVGADERMGRGSSALGAFKAALMLRGIIDCPLTMPPYLPLSPDEIAAIVPFLEAADLSLAPGAPSGQGPPRAS